jgi:AcrR family transcriptional regulator
MLAAARRQLSGGSGTVQMNALAQDAGVGVGTVYRHFPTVQSLLEALAAERFRELVEVAQAAAKAPDPLDGLRQMFQFALAYAADPGFATVLKALRAVLRRAHREGLVRKDIHVEDVILLLCGFQHSVRVGKVSAQRANKYLAVLADGLRA